MSLPLYVLGFVFDETKEHVLLIRKNRPDFQKGKLNGLGGAKEKEDADLLIAIKRETKEEANLEIENYEPYYVYGHDGDEFQMTVFRAFIPLAELKKFQTTTDEKLKLIKVKDLLKYPLVNEVETLINTALKSEYICSNNMQ